MRVVREIAHPHCRITIYAWNNRYLIKLEQGLLEQTYKIDQSDISNEEELLKLLDQNFIDDALERFGQMHQSFLAARTRIEG